jgi:hypothetical protein
VIDVDRVGGYAVEDFWELVRARADKRLILDPDEFTSWPQRRNCISRRNTRPK